jgi:hypothetical protein
LRLGRFSFGTFLLLVFEDLVLVAAKERLARARGGRSGALTAVWRLAPIALAGEKAGVLRRCRRLAPFLRSDDRPALLGRVERQVDSLGAEAAWIAPRSLAELVGGPNEIAAGRPIGVCHRPADLLGIGIAHRPGFPEQGIRDHRLRDTERGGGFPNATLT